MSLTIALCDACPSLDVDEMTIALLNIFDSRGMGFHLLKALVDHEVEETGTIFHGCLTSMLTSIRERSRAAPSKLRGNKAAIYLCEMERECVLENNFTESP